MATVKQVVGARVALPCAGMPTLASATYAVSDAYNCATNQPPDVIVEASAQAVSPAGNKQLVLFLQESLDGVNFRNGPTSGTSTTEEPALKFLGTLQLPVSGVTSLATFSVLSTLGYVPAAFKVVVKNDAGVALSSGSLATSEISRTVV